MSRWRTRVSSADVVVPDAGRDHGRASTAAWGAARVALALPALGSRTRLLGVSGIHGADGLLLQSELNAMTRNKSLFHSHLARVRLFSDSAMASLPENVTGMAWDHGGVRVV